jgi:hypothetical protein
MRSPPRESPSMIVEIRATFGRIGDLIVFASILSTITGDLNPLEE